MHFRNQLACQNANFDGADELLFVPRRDFRGRLRVEPLQDTMQMAGRMFLNACAKPLAQFFRALRNFRKTLAQRAQIQSCPDGENRQAFALPQVVQNLQSQLAVASRGCLIVEPKNVDQMEWNDAAFGWSGLCGANIKAAIELRRIAGHNFPAELLRELHAERRLSRCRRTNDGHERQERFIFAHRKRRCRARTKRKMSTKSARRRLPRTCWRGSFTGKRLRSANYTGNKTAARCTVR